MVRRCAVLFAVPLVAALTMSGAASAEEPERLGFLVVSPAKGDLTSAIDVATSGVCTRGQMFAVMLDGPNLKGRDRGNLIGVTKIATIGPESYPGHYVVPLPTDLATYLAAAAPGQRIKGDYTLTFACRDTLDTADLQVFGATITIDGKGRYVAQEESGTPIDELIEGYVPGSAGFAYGDPTAPDPDEVAEYAAEQSVVTTASSETFSMRTLLILSGVLLLLVAAYGWWRGRGRSDGADGQADDTSVGAAR